jgi:hypothetical protein
MSESDSIVAEVRRIRDEHAARFNYDPEAIFRDIKEQERQSGRKYVSFANEASAPAPSQKVQTAGAANPSSSSTQCSVP